MLLDLGALTTAHAREVWMCWSWVIETWADCDRGSCSSQAWSKQWKWRWWKQFLSQGMDGYSKADKYGKISNSKIWSQMRSGQKR